MHGMRQFGGTVFGSVERLTSVVTGPIVGFFDGGTGASSNSPKVATLEQEVIRLRAQLSQEQLSRAQYQQLSQLLQLSGRGGDRDLAPPVVAAGEGHAPTGNPPAP